MTINKKSPNFAFLAKHDAILVDYAESHIIRTIEYWDNEKRRWPQRQHTAVLVAESITRRFFNVIHMLSHSIPIIAIQANVIEVGGVKSLNFIKVLDTYEEIDDGEVIGNKTYDLNYWNEKASCVVDSAKALQQACSGTIENSELNFTKDYVSITLNNNNCCSLRKRSGEKSRLGFRVPDNFIDEAKELLDSYSISYVSKWKRLFITSDATAFQKNPELFKQLMIIASKYWGHS